MNMVDLLITIIISSFGYEIGKWQGRRERTTKPLTLIYTCHICDFTAKTDNDKTFDEIIRLHRESHV